MRENLETITKCEARKQDKYRIQILNIEELQRGNKKNKAGLIRENKEIIWSKFRRGTEGKSQYRVNARELS